MIENLIIGSGFSALCSYLMLKKFNTKILHYTKVNSNPNFLINRDNLNSNKLFSKRSISFGNINYKLHYNIKIHDRLIGGGNTNIWGGFINIENIPDNYLKIFNQNSINFQKLKLETNGYKTNNSSIRQLRDKNNNILNSELFLKNCIHGFLHSFKVEENKIILKIFDQKENNFTFLNTKKLILAISFPQLIDLLFRSKFLNECIEEIKLVKDVIVRNDLIKRLSSELGVVESEVMNRFEELKPKRRYAEKKEKDDQSSIRHYDSKSDKAQLEILLHHLNIQNPLDLKKALTIQYKTERQFLLLFPHITNN